MLPADLGPGIQEVAIPIEDHHRLRAATEHEHVVVRIDADIRDLDERPALRTLEEALDDLVAIASDVVAHVASTQPPDQR